MTKNKKRKIYILLAIAALIVGIGLYAMVINSHIQQATKDRVVFDFDDKEAGIPSEVVERLREIDPQCIIVLGCGILNYDTPSTPLRDRLDTGIALYNAGVAPKILLTGDNGQVGYNEIHAMLTYTLGEGVPPEDIFCDHAGFSTKESMIRAAEIFDVKRAVIVTQRYHEYRSLYNAGKMNIEALGVSAALSGAPGPALEMREVLARNKDFLLFNFGNPSAMGGEKIDLMGDGTISHGE